MIEISQLAPGQLFAGRYQINRLIRAGGMGAVYEGVHKDTRRRVAIKVMRPEIIGNPEARQRFVQEAQVASVIESPYIVDVLDAGVEGEIPFIVMEFLVGEELGDMLLRVGRLAPQDAIPMLLLAARALDRAHARGVVHRDLKPENLFLVHREDEAPTLKILDFGIAKVLQAAGGGTTRATGTPLYMAPEQTARSSTIGAATDVWALGLIAYSMLVGRPYWEGGDMNQLFAEILMAPLESPVARASRLGVGLPPDFDRWFFACVNRDATQRYQRAGEAMQALAALFGLAPQLTPQPPVVTPAHGIPVYNPTPQNFTPQNYTPPNVTPQHTSQQFTPQQFTPQQYPTNLTPHGVPVMPRPNSGTMMMPDPGAHGPSIPGAMQGATPYGVAGTHGGPARPPSDSSTTKYLVIGAAVVAAITLVVLGIALGGGKKAPPDTTANIDEPKKTSKANANASGSASSAVDGDLLKPSDAKKQIESANKWQDAAGIQVQRHEVTNAEYALFLRTLDADARAKAEPLKAWSGLKVPSSMAPKPVVWVTWERADAFCRALDAKLPTSGEWGAAVGDVYPWGSTWPPSGGLSGVAVGKPEGTDLADVESSTTDRNNDDVYDLAGNVQEWTSTVKDGLATVRGGSITMKNEDAIVAVKDGNQMFTEAGAGTGAKLEATAGPHLGFRCVK